MESDGDTFWAWDSPFVSPVYRLTVFILSLTALEKEKETERKNIYSIIVYSSITEKRTARESKCLI